MNQGNRCGRLFGLAALTIAALIAATAANADPGLPGVQLPTLPGLPGVGVGASAGIGVGVGAKTTSNGFTLGPLVVIDRGTHPVKAARKVCHTVRHHRTCSRVLAATDLSEHDLTIDQAFVYTGPNPCTGEPVTATGTNNDNVKIMVDGSGGIHEIAHTVNFHGSGTSITGAQYQVLDQQFLDVNIPTPTFEETDQFKTHVIRQGETLPSPDDYFMTAFFHMTSNANGVVSVLNDSGPQMTCR